MGSPMGNQNASGPHTYSGSVNGSKNFKNKFGESKKDIHARHAKQYAEEQARQKQRNKNK